MLPVEMGLNHRQIVLQKLAKLALGLLLVLKLQIDKLLGAHLELIFSGAVRLAQRKKIFRLLFELAVLLSEGIIHRDEVI